MSNERIDHAAEAIEAMDRLRRGDVSSEAEHRALQAICQAAATLYLAEQQRIANIIALGQYTTAPGDMPVFRSVVFYGDGLRPDIAAALGIEVES